MTFKHLLTISQVAKRFGLSRSTLLYYDKLNLLSPSARSSANYRLYTDADIKRLERIILFRRVGIPINDIIRLLSDHSSGSDELLEKRLKKLNQEISLLRQQQLMIVHLLKCPVRLKETRFLDKKGWIKILQASGMNEQDMCRWHQEFERLAPEAHQDFLESLNIGTDEIKSIRNFSRSARLED